MKLFLPYFIIAFVCAVLSANSQTVEQNTAIEFKTVATGTTADNVALLDPTTGELKQVDTATFGAGLTVTETQDLADVLANDASAGGTVITNVGTPVATTDAANKDYVDTSLAALSVDDADADATNEIQTLSISGDDITLSNTGGTVSINTKFIPYTDFKVWKGDGNTDLTLVEAGDVGKGWIDSTTWIFGEYVSGAVTSAASWNIILIYNK